MVRVKAQRVGLEALWVEGCSSHHLVLSLTSSNQAPALSCGVRAQILTMIQNHLEHEDNGSLNELTIRILVPDATRQGRYFLLQLARQRYAEYQRSAFSDSGASHAPKRNANLGLVRTYTGQLQLTRQLLTTQMLWIHCASTFGAKHPQQRGHSFPFDGQRARRCFFTQLVVRCGMLGTGGASAMLHCRAPYDLGWRPLRCWLHP